MKFSAKVMACTLVPVVVLAVAAGAGAFGVRIAADRFEQVFETQQPLSRAVLEMYAHGLQTGQALRNIILDPDNPTAYRNLESGVAAYDQAASEAAILAQGSAAAAVLAEVAELRNQQAAARDRILALARTDRQAATALLVREETPAWRQMRARLIDLAAQTEEQMRSSREQALATAQGIAYVVIAIALLGIAVGVVSPYALRRMLIRDLGGEPEAARQVVRAVANGDLGYAVPLAAGDSTSLLASLNQMRASLEEMMVGLRSTVREMTTASREIAQGNADLSSRTEQQASSLQQTAASMEQMTATVKHNAEAARQANQLAASASQVAAKGGAVVSQVIQRMEEISDSSSKIAEIINVIDGIAFQTNILALNAAVEAARAGEQGRGFAVVAGEVRNLAQRSAQAAREIKALITDSVIKVESGSALVGDAGQTMGEIVAQVKRVTDLIGEITSATLEQSSGIGQVNQALNQLDQMTQQNAALVEQSAAAAASLREQADRLAQAVAAFGLSRQETRQAIDSAQARASATLAQRTAAAPPPAAPSRKSPPAARAAAPARKPQADAGGDWQEF